MSVVAGALAAGATIAALWPCIGRASVRGRGRQRPATATATALDLVAIAERIAREVRAGAGAHRAVTAALAGAPHLAPEVAASLAADAPLVDSLAAHRATGDERDLLVHALRIGTVHTHVLPAVLDRTIDVVRERRAWRLERDAQSAQARTSARVLTVVPLAFAGWGALSSPAVREAYATSTATAAVALVGIALNAVGWWWMRAAVRGPR